MKYKCSISGNECPFDFSEDLGCCGCSRDEANDNCPIRKYEPSDEQKGKVFRISDWCKNLIIEDEVDEIWKDIDGYEGLYQVSNTGKIKSFRFSTRYSKKSENTEHILKPSITREGYLHVTLYSNPNSKKKYTVHQLVATAFIPNPNNYPTINHKDENKLNNNVGNLEWCTYSYNNAYGTARIRSSITKGKPIQQLTLEGIQLAEYRSIGIAAKLLNISRAGIYACCSGKIQTLNGYIWRYAK